MLHLPGEVRGRCQAFTLIEIGTVVPDGVGTKAPLSMSYLGEWSVNNYRPPGHERAKAFLYSVGPSLAYSWDKPGYGNYCTTEYAPTNGTRSTRRIWAYSN